jgi:hypothetical protein
MRSGDLIGTTRRELATAADRLNNSIGALVAFSCLARHWEATARGLDTAIDAIYANYPTTGFHSLGEQAGMLLVNHTLTGLAIASHGFAGARSNAGGVAESIGEVAP